MMKVMLRVLIFITHILNFKLSISKLVKNSQAYNLNESVKLIGAAQESYLGTKKITDYLMSRKRVKI